MRAFFVYLFLSTLFVTSIFASRGGSHSTTHSSATHNTTPHATTPHSSLPHSKSTHSKSKSRIETHGSDRVIVRGYTRKDGTFVESHTRSLPGSASKVGGGVTSPVPNTRLIATAFSSGHYSPVVTSIGSRDSKGRIVRSESAKYEFMKTTGYPHGRPGYVVDHVLALKRGGTDAPNNMQWQTISEAKAKDKLE